MFALTWSHKALLTLLSIGTPMWFSPQGADLTKYISIPILHGPSSSIPFVLREHFQNKVSSRALFSYILSPVSTVLNDIISTMFNRKFMEELFKPQELYSKKALRTVYDRLAHASIMRLNQASMDKVSRRLPLSPWLHFLYLFWMIIAWNQMRWRMQWCLAGGGVGRHI